MFCTADVNQHNVPGNPDAADIMVYTEMLHLEIMIWRRLNRSSSTSCYLATMKFLPLVRLQFSDILVMCSTKKHTGNATPSHSTMYMLSSIRTERIG